MLEIDELDPDCGTSSDGENNMNRASAAEAAISTLKEDSWSRSTDTETVT